MEKIINIKIEKKKEGKEVYYLATSNELQGLIAEGRTYTETLEIARDVAKNIIEIDKELGKSFIPVEKQKEYPLVVNI